MATSRDSNGAEDPVMATPPFSVRISRSTNGSQPGTTWISAKKKYTVSACFVRVERVAGFQNGVQADEPWMAQPVVEAVQVQGVLAPHAAVHEGLDAPEQIGGLAAAPRADARQRLAGHGGGGQVPWCAGGQRQLLRVQDDFGERLRHWVTRLGDVNWQLLFPVEALAASRRGASARHGHRPMRQPARGAGLRPRVAVSFGVA